jgi:hypothetical protein
MREDVSCREFQALLDVLSAGGAQQDDRTGMHRHAGRCRDCEVLWHVHDHLRADQPDELEARVPDELVDGMWTRVFAALRNRATASARPSRVRAKRGWLPAALAAAVIALLLVSGLLFDELRRARQREQALELAVQRRSPVAEIPARGDGGSRGARRMAGWALGLALRAKPEFTAAELQAWLAEMPPARVLVDAGRVRSVLRRYLHLRALTGPVTRAGVRLEDGLTAGELNRLVATFGLDPQTRIPRSRVMDWVTATPATGRGNDGGGSPAVRGESDG